MTTGKKAFGVQSPTTGDPVSWQTWSSGSGTIPNVTGDANWGKLTLTAAGQEGRSPVYNLGSVLDYVFALTENVYGTGSGSSATLQIRGSTGSFAQDDTLPVWNNYIPTFIRSWKYVQVRKVNNYASGTIWHIATSVALIDGRVAPHNGILPGDIIALDSGTRVPLNIKNIIGTALQPITIINSGGLVEINTTSGWYGFWMQNCQHVRFTGTGDGGITYGIKVTRAPNNGIIFQNKSEYLEFDHIEFLRIDGTSQVGIQGQTVTTSVADYDYNGDGSINSSDLVTRANFTQHNVSVHDCHFNGGVGTNYCQMALYIGNSNYLDELNPACSGVSVYNNLMENLSDKVLQVGSVTSGMLIYNNVINKGCQGVSITNPMAISVNPGSNGLVYNNYIIDTPGYGIGYNGTGGTIYNNVIVRPGKAGTYFTHGIAVIYPGGYSHSANTYVCNNTIVNPVGDCIAFGNNYGSNKVQNNILVNPGAGYQYVERPAGTFLITNNYQTMTIGNVHFSNVGTDDYSLASNSPAINYGTDLSAIGITTDYAGISRPQSSAYDAGAYEFFV